MYDLGLLFTQIITLFQSWLTIDVLMFGHTFKLWGVFAFILLLGLFVRLIQFLTGVDLGGDSEGDIHRFHIDGFH